jgi:hypothetical protein
MWVDQQSTVLLMSEQHAPTWSNAVIKIQLFVIWCVCGAERNLHNPSKPRAFKAKRLGAVSRARTAPPWLFISMYEQQCVLNAHSLCSVPTDTRERFGNKQKEHLHNSSLESKQGRIFQLSIMGVFFSYLNIYDASVLSKLMPHWKQSLFLGISEMRRRFEIQQKMTEQTWCSCSLT